jgi:hypothetical protein
LRRKMGLSGDALRERVAVTLTDLNHPAVALFRCNAFLGIAGYTPN